MSHTKLDLEALVAAGVISESKRQEIISWNEKSREGEWISRLLQILAGFGAIVTGLGVMLLIAANWDTISDIMKTIIMISTTALIYIAGYYWSYRNTNYPKTGQALMLLGSMFYGASIFLLGQVYNLGGTFSSALLVWWLGIIPLAYSTGFVSIFLLGISLIYAYIFSRIVDFSGMSGFVIADVFLAVGYLSLVLVRFHRSDTYKSFSRILSWTGGMSILSGLFAYTFFDFWTSGGSSWYSTRDPSSTMWILWGLIWVAFIALVVDIVAKKSLDKASDVPFLLGLAPIGILFFYTLTESLSGERYYRGDYSLQSLSLFTPVLFMNILYIVVVALMIWGGVRRENRAIVNIAMIFLAIYLFGKYLAFAFDSKMAGAYVFIGGGIACIGLTFLIEKIRRRLMRSMH
jgi:uncharacterized membrane protein